MEDLLDQCLKKSEDMIKQLIEIEMGYINNNHPDFIDTLSAVQREEKQQQQQQEQQQE
jgi:dynamin 1-like protein